MTKEECNVLINLLKTEGYYLVEESEPFNYPMEISKVFNDLNDYEVQLSVNKDQRESDKKILQESQAKIILARKDKASEESIKDLVDFSKEAQIEYNLSLELVAKTKENIRISKYLIEKLRKESKQIRDVKIKFPKGVKSETGIKCERCGNLEASPTINPLASQIYGDDTIYNLCEDCVNLLAEEV